MLERFMPGLNGSILKAKCDTYVSIIFLMDKMCLVFSQQNSENPFYFIYYQPLSLPARSASDIVPVICPLILL